MADPILTTLGEVSAMCGDFAEGPIKPDCVWLSRKVSLLSHLGEEIREFVNRGGAGGGCGSSSSGSCLDDLSAAFEAAKGFLLLGQAINALSKNIPIQFHYVTWQLEKVLGNFPYDYFEISDEVQEQVDLVRTQLRRATEKGGTPNLKTFQEIYNHKELKRESSSRPKSLQIESSSSSDHVDCDLKEIVILVAEVNGKSSNDAEKMTSNLMEILEKAGDVASETKSIKSGRKVEELKRSDSVVIPEDFCCPISLELMTDPVIVSTGQTYKRSFIQKWIDCGNKTCPKTQQRLQNLTLTPTTC